MNTNIRNTVHAKNVSQSPSKEKRLVSSRIPNGFLSRHDRPSDFAIGRQKTGSPFPRGQLTRGNSRPLLVGGGGGRGTWNYGCDVRGERHKLLGGRLLSGLANWFPAARLDYANRIYAC